MSPSLSDREALARWVAHGDEDALAHVILRHGGRVFGVALRGTHGDPLLAEEVTQTVFAIMARKASALSSHPSLIAWLHRATVLEASHRRRRESARRRAHTAYAAAMISSPSPAFHDERPDLDEALERLPESDRLVVVQRFYEALSFADIAARLGKTEAAVRKQTSRALAKLQTLLRRRGVAVSVAGLTTALTHHATATTLPSSLAASLAAHSAAASTTLTGGHLALHSLALMTYGHKTLLTVAALVLILLSLGGSYSMGLAQARAMRANVESTTHATVPKPPPIHFIGKIVDETFSKLSETAKSEPKLDVRELFELLLKNNNLIYIPDRDFYGTSQTTERELARFRPEHLPEGLAVLREYGAKLRSDSLSRHPAGDAVGHYETLAGVVFAFWAKSDLPAACAALVSPAYLRPDGKVSVHALRLTMDAWAEQDPAATLRWGLDLVDQGLVPVEREEGVRGELFGAWFARDPAGAWQELYERLPDQPSLVSEGLRGMLAEPSGQAALKAWLAPGAEPAARAQALELLQNHLRWSRRKAAIEEVSGLLALDETTREEVRHGL